jgi:hypothetical protein
MFFQRGHEDQNHHIFQSIPATHMRSSTPGEQQNAEQAQLFENILSEIGDGVQCSDIWVF